MNAADVLLGILFTATLVLYGIMLWKYIQMKNNP